MKKLVWDTSALLSIKEPDTNGYSPGHSLFKDFSDGWIKGPYQNIFPALAYFEVQATISRKHSDGKNILRDFYIIDDHAVVYPIDQELIARSYELVAKPGFEKLRGADLIFACIAHLEHAFLVTLDNGFDAVADTIKVVNLNTSRDQARYAHHFE